MKLSFKRCKLFLIAAVLSLVMTAGASADMGRGYGQRGRMHHGGGWHHDGYGHHGWGAFNDLSEEDRKKLEEERKAFFEETEELRREVYQKFLELASEMAKKNPDPAKAAAIQKTISDSQARLAQKRLDHLFRVRKINPDLAMGFGGGHMGFGMMHGTMMGYGGSGYRGYPDCPYGGPGGYGRGKGMMGPGGWDRGESRQYHMGSGSMME